MGTRVVATTLIDLSHLQEGSTSAELIGETVGRLALEMHRKGARLSTLAVTVKPCELGLDLTATAVVGNGVLR